MTNPITLYELNTMIRGVVEDAFDKVYWVVGEFSEARQAYNGHFYGELVEKSKDGQTVVAKASVKCWARQYNVLKYRFMQEAGQEIRGGMKVLIAVRVTFHEQYGFSLIMEDIDASYTLGDMAKRRQDILRRLEEDGIIDDNKMLPLPRMLNRIAIVSAQTAAGYGDFCNQLLANDYRLRFTTRLFPAVMQGQHVEESVMAALSAIEDDFEAWDAVVIIRGGGATSDLSDFDSYPLAQKVACMPIPVFVGIGHDRDETVLDYVAHTRLKTPTAVATFLVDHQANELALVGALRDRILVATRNRLHQEKLHFERLAQTLPLRFGQVRSREENRIVVLSQRLTSAVQRRLQLQHNVLSMMEQSLRANSRQLLQDNRHRLDLLEQRVTSLDPERLLQRGYSMTMLGDRILTDASQVKKGDVITTRLKQGTVYSTILTLES